VEEVYEIEERALVTPRELSVRTVDQLQTVLLIVLTKLIVVPGESCQWPNRLRVDTVQQLTGETKPKRRQH